MRALEFLREWEKEAIYEVLNKFVRETGKRITVNNAMFAIEHSSVLEKILTCEPYKSSIQAFGIDETIRCISYILDHDPSYLSREVKNAEECFLEEPFPRYLVSICYSLLYRCLDDIRNEILKESIWNNISTTANMTRFDNAMMFILKLQFSNTELFDRAIQLLGDQNDLSNFVGELIIYELSPIEDYSHQYVIEAIQERLNSENDLRKISNYRKYIRKYFYDRFMSRLRSLLFFNTSDFS